MKILSIEKYKGQTFAVKLEGNRVMYLHRDTISEYSLKADMDIPASALKEIFHYSELKRAKERSLYLLDVKDYSIADMFKKLKANYSEKTCSEVVEYLTQKGFLNDNRYAQQLARRLFEVKLYGKYRAKQEMFLKGLDKNIIEDAISNYDDDTIERLCSLIEKKYKRFIYDDKGRTKTKNALVRYGYSYNEINCAMEYFVENLDKEN